MTTISAIIPNYNHGHRISAAVAALRRQTLPADEIIIVDDGSTDDSLTIIRNLMTQDAKIRLLIHERNYGAIVAINTGIKAAKGKYLYLAAADDVSHPELLEILYDALAPHKNAAFSSAEVGLYSVTGDLIGVRPPARPSDKRQYFDREASANLFKKIDNFILTGAALLRSQAVEEAEYLKPELGAFADGFLVRQLAFRHGFVFVPSVLAEWHIDASGLSRSAALNADVTSGQMHAAGLAFAAEPAIPSDYWPRFRQRWCFAVVRLALDTPRDGRAVLEKFAPGPKLLKEIFCRLARFGPGGKLICLGWASLWYRPTSFLSLARTYFARRGNGSLKSD